MFCSHLQDQVAKVRRRLLGRRQSEDYVRSAQSLHSAPESHPKKSYKFGFRTGAPFSPTLLYEPPLRPMNKDRKKGDERIERMRTIPSPEMQRGNRNNPRPLIRPCRKQFLRLEVCAHGAARAGRQIEGASPSESEDKYTREEGPRAKKPVPRARRGGSRPFVRSSPIYSPWHGRRTRTRLRVRTLILSPTHKKKKKKKN